mmetsp:Transcript_2080/g.3616  ORF Transcript_2080/g.3616 Transcript_2080/m.3616 type:complete len:280 (-) Transcript_2080:999-1838(-)
MRILPGIMRNGLVMHRSGRDRVQGQVELIVPAELESSLRQSIVPLLCPWVSFGQVGRMGSNAVRNDASLHILAIRQPQMLLGRHIAEHGSAHSTDVGRTDGAGNVVVARGNVCGQRPQGVEGCLVAPVELFPHVVRDLVQGHVSRSFVHYLNALLPGSHGQITLDLEFTELGLIIGILDTARTESIPDAQGHIILLANVQDVIPVLVCKILLVLGDAKFGMNGTTTADNTSEAFCGEWHEAQQHTSMNRPIVHTLFSLLNQRLTEHLPCQILCNAIDLL